jgi:hypothetical protein
MNKINYVVVGANKNPLYLDFWPIVSKIWKENFDVTPVLGLIDDVDSDIEEYEFGLVKKFKSCNANTGFQSQIVRLYLPKYLNGNCLISDIDMFPLSRKYFDECAKKLTEDNLLIYSSNHSQTINTNMFPMCYVAANSDTFKNVFDLNLSWNDFCLLLANRNEDWYTDQRYLYDKVMEFGKKTNKLILLGRSWNNDRIDRGNWGYNPDLVKNGHYIDCHSLRPYQTYKHEINRLLELL